MLPSRYRLRRSADFQRVVRRGRRAFSSTVVVHGCPAASADAPAQVGFVVSKAVGNAVVRNRVKRRLRAIVGERVEEMSGHLVVIRAIPAAADADTRQLSSDVDRCVSSMLSSAPARDRGARR